MREEVRVLCTDSRELRRFVSRLYLDTRVHYCRDLAHFLSVIDHEDVLVAWDRDVVPYLDSNPGVLRLFTPNRGLHWVLHSGHSEHRRYDDAVWHCDPTPHWKVSRWLVDRRQ